MGVLATAAGSGEEKREMERREKTDRKGMMKRREEKRSHRIV